MLCISNVCKSHVIEDHVSVRLAYAKVVVVIIISSICILIYRLLPCKTGVYNNPGIWC